MRSRKCPACIRYAVIFPQSPQNLISGTMPTSTSQISYVPSHWTAYASLSRKEIPKNRPSARQSPVPANRPWLPLRSAKTLTEVSLRFCYAADVSVFDSDSLGAFVTSHYPASKRKVLPIYYRRRPNSQSRRCSNSDQFILSLRAQSVNSIANVARYHASNPTIHISNGIQPIPSILTAGRHPHLLPQRCRSRIRLPYRTLRANHLHMLIPGPPRLLPSTRHP